jgi:hypothetical protein
MEYLNEGNWEIPDSPSQIFSTSVDCSEERPRDWPGGAAFFWGNAIDINLNAVESLRALEYHILTPLTAFSISQSYLANTPAPMQVVDEPERHYRWLRHYKELAYHASEDLVSGFSSLQAIKSLLMLTTGGKPHHASSTHSPASGFSFSQWQCGSWHHYPQRLDSGSRTNNERER